MFRIGSALFIPSYLTVTLYRAFASPNDEGNVVVMSLLAVSTAIRFCGITFGYTAINILLNYSEWQDPTVEVKPRLMAVCSVSAASRWHCKWGSAEHRITDALLWADRGRRAVVVERKRQP
jgi:hypothetical protein